MNRLIDLHAHFPMHTHFPPRFAHQPPPVGKEIEYFAAQHLLNYQNGKPRVSLDELVAGSPGGIGSVLYDPDDEFFRNATPRPEAFPNLLAQMDNVEKQVAGRVKIVRNPAQLQQCLDDGGKFLFHCVEGAFAFGGDPANVDALAARGVAYVVIAHLFYRGVATCQNAIPFVPDSLFAKVLNPQQQANVGLTDLGTQIVARLLQRGILVDITHASDQAQQDILNLARDHGNAPVISSHNGVRPTSDYPLNLSPAVVRQIAASNGVVGVILYPHWLRQPSQQMGGDESIQVVFNAIDCLHEITGNYDHIAIGTDLDGFIKPIEECPDYSHTASVVAAIQQRYPSAADQLLWTNARDVLARGWKGA
jgi:microsomal dipeptidase-like Zn-dependent dipeptidase